MRMIDECANGMTINIDNEVIYHLGCFVGVLSSHD